MIRVKFLDKTPQPLHMPTGQRFVSPCVKEARFLAAKSNPSSSQRNPPPLLKKTTPTPPPTQPPPTSSRKHPHYLLISCRSPSLGQREQPNLHTHPPCTMPTSRPPSHFLPHGDPRHVVSAPFTLDARTQPKKTSLDQNLYWPMSCLKCRER